jgi:flagellar capping protein FliD
MKNFDLKTWLPILFTAITLTMGVGIAYGQLSTQLDSLKSQVDTIKTEKKDQEERYEQKIDQTKSSVQEMQQEQAKMQLMLELLLQKEGIALPSNTAN